MDGSATRDLILDATERMLIRSGLANLTIDAVAAEANMSKGGVLHYFSTKRDLLMAGLDRFEERFLSRREGIMASLPESPSRLARATIRAVLEARKIVPSAGHYRIDMLENVDFRQKIGDLKMRIFEDLSAGAKHPEIAAMLLYLMDGLWLNEMHRPNPIPGAYENKAKQRLVKYAEELYADIDS